MKLSHRAALITGTSPNIGGGIAEELAREGAGVVCVDVDRDRAGRAAAAIRARGGRALGVGCDASEEGSVLAALAEGERTFGVIDLLVNNAVVFDQRGVFDMPLDAWRRQLAVILDGAFLFTKYVARRLVDAGRGGSIVNVISTAGHQGQPGNVGYCTGKAGLLNFTRSVAMELACHGIRVNSLTPTATDPQEGIERARRWGEPPPDPSIAAVFERFRRGVPMRRLPSPHDYARAIMFLASDDAAMITGADLRVDAGALSRYWAWDPGER